MKSLVIFSLKIFFLSTELTFAQGFDKGFSAYMLGDYATAMLEWRNKAELGSSTSMANLGNMYEVGAGVEQSNILAHQWYNLAASNGERIYKQKNCRKSDDKIRDFFSGFTS